ncbi:2-oxo acid dehydrogenase subunit E2 [Negadavirga shengliensis]|uniref:Dihydrolipoamide acetyltransferase component of pyruvate dehydrogenase complex n=1 Tax=Negadavirga shengliensis TaxID=1389218 RepID=A0ABV9T9G6_9BACT
MAIEVKIPQISEGVDSAQVIEVLVSEGDNIKKEQSIIAVETDKASVEVPSSDSGKVKEIKVKEGDEVKVGDVILILEEDEEKEGGEGKEEGGGKGQKTEKSKGEDQEEEDKGKEEEGKAKEDEEKEDEEGEKTEEGDEKEGKVEKKKGKEEDKEKEEKDGEEEGEEKMKEDGEKEKKPGKNGEKEEQDSEGVPASPAVRRLAREMGVEISKVQGSGPGGRITEADVKAYLKEGKQDLRGSSLPDFSQWGPVEKEPLSHIRKATAKNTLASWQSVPHVFQFDEADISGIEKYMEKYKKDAEEAGGKLTLTAILVKVLANALQQFPQFNASIDMENEEVIFKKYYHIGIAVDTEKGLLVPVVRDVDKKTVMDLAIEITALAEKTRQGKLKPEEMEGGNIAVSNLGGIGGTQFTPIIYSPHVAILGISRAKMQPVYIDDGFEARPILPVSLSYDHRLIDGADGVKFLRWICQALEDPYKALLGA